MKQKVLGFTLALALLVPVGIVAAGPGGAAAAKGTVCKPPVGKVIVTPGYGTTAKKQTISFKLPLTGCKGGGVTSGSSVGKLPPAAAAACKDIGKLAAPMTINTVITWNTKATSTFAGKSTTKGTTATVTGKVTKGLFKGLTVTTVVTFAKDPKGGACTNASPLKSLIIKGTKPFTIK